METFLLGVFVVATTGLAAFFVEHRKTLREIETDLKRYLERLEIAAEKAEPSVWVHYEATAAIIRSFISKYFE